jgi:two-component system, LuxR family, response regulator FixJ
MLAQSSSNQPRAEIFVLEDERGVRDMVSLLLSNAGYEVICFAEGSGFLAAARQRVPACILLDVFVPGKSGIEVLKELHAKQYPAPVMVMSGQGDIGTAVTAMKLGACDFIEKPFQGRELLDRIARALHSFVRQEESPAGMCPLQLPGAEPLTPRERDVLQQFVAGASNKEAARALGISHRTVEDHRLRIMKKFGAKNYADLIRKVMTKGRELSG